MRHTYEENVVSILLGIALGLAMTALRLMYG